ncbi:hypothetical protein ACQQCD_06510 [Pseudarthrobacter sp. J1763]|jgi:hypothetical protein|uniref:hypothetical protein n=1 Tax=Micrococcaceae TaxID=1268 RepID=UPI000052671A|nr:MULTISPECIES: hypothetical protein [Micrococcaceae]ABK05552.1 hypothetical protein Arth_4381 [Arthrobacter sp. FB24]MDP9988806.1 hypothetical protein [Arthrobacter oryzae]UKA71428.1 hypothetical protein LFT49_01365 [Arthrobacter sp. FW306-06-A]WJH26660.1 hypothetical protein JCQ34_20355 [Pseudarthrobacter defluvii]
MTTANPAPGGPLSTAPDSPAVRVVVVENPHCLQEDLAVAVKQVRDTAESGDRRGILMTRLGQSLFTVEASPDVPYGTTLERDLWRRRAVPGSDQAAPVL